MSNQVLPAVADFRAILKGSLIRVLSEGFLKVSLLSATSPSGLVLARLAASIALVVGAGLSLTTTAVLLGEVKQKMLREIPFAYLPSVEKEFA